MTLEHKEITCDHRKVLYLISLYAVAAETSKQNERWIRQVPLFVLMFEAIVRGKLDFDYAPASIRLSYKGKSMRRWLNISQEGKTALEDLWDDGLVNGIKLSSDDFQPVTAYQVSSLGQTYLSQMCPSEREEINSFVFPQPLIEPKALQVSYDGYRFYLRSGAFLRASSVTDSEDVSYVSSPYLPHCLRSPGYYQVTETSNAHRAQECFSGCSNITKSTTEVIALDTVYSLIGEWVPFGSNQIVALNERIGALDRCQGGILTSQIDVSPTDAHFKMPVGQTQVRILDYDFVRCINLEAESHFPESPGIVQIEHFGMHLNCDGCLVYGIKVDAIMNRASNDVPIDYLARLLVDVHQDSSILINDLLSRYQLSMLDMIYLGDSFQRNKYNCIMAKSIVPKVPAQTYKTDKKLANELAQVLGDIQACYDLTPNDVLILGRAGCLLVGPNNARFEEEMTAYVGLVSRDLFCKNFFARTFVLDARLKDIRQLIHFLQKEPSKVALVRQRLTIVSKDTILLAETLEYLLDSLEDVELGFTARTLAKNLRDMERDRGGTGLDGKMYKILSLQQLHGQILLRCRDSGKLMDNTMQQLEQLQMIAESMATSQLESASLDMSLNTHILSKAVRSQENGECVLQALKFLVAGVFLFDLIDHLDGGTWHTEVPHWVRKYLLENLYAHPFVWWGVNLVLLVCSQIVLYQMARRMVRQYMGWYAVTLELNEKISIKQLNRFLASKCIIQMEKRHICQSVIDGNMGGQFMSVRWKEQRKQNTEAWNNKTIVQAVVDVKHQFLLYVTIHFHARKNMLSNSECLQKFRQQMKKASVLSS